MERVRVFFDNGLWQMRDQIGWSIEVTSADNSGRGEANNTGDIVETALILGRWGYTEYYADAERVGDRGDFKKVVRKFMRKVMQREEKNKNPTFTEKKQRNITKYIDEWFTQNYSWANYLLNNPDGDDTSDGGGAGANAHADAAMATQASEAADDADDDGDAGEGWGDGL